MYRPALVLAMVLISSLHSPAAEAPRIVRENIEWLDVWIPGNAVTNQPRVLLIGDSITRGYYKGVETALQGRAVVCRLATSKSLGDPVLLAEVSLVLGQAKFDVVHFNNGMHGWGYTEEEYAAALPKLLAVIRKGAPHAKLICATTTPVRVAGKVEQIDAKTDRVKARNHSVETLMKSEKIPVNDLFGLVAARPEWFSNDGVHLNTKGSAKLADQVAVEISKLLEMKSEAGQAEKKK